MNQDSPSAAWQLVVARGVIGLIFGILAIVWPVTTGLALVMLWGFWALLEGLGALAQAVRATTGRARLGHALLGLAGLVAAFLAIFSPRLTAATLTWILGIWLILRGILDGITAFTRERITPRWLFLPSAVLSVVLGAFFLANPGRAAVGIAVLLGIVAVAWGVVFIASGLLLRPRLSVAPTRERN
jgi:uncharacterized membrane protein HdeD (DUF308 family)